MQFRRLACPLALAAGLLAATGAHAASLQKVSSWGATGVPATASMYIYVPDKLATKPPILVLSHYCSGTASGVFGQAQTGGLVKAADQYGFIMVVPQTTNNCWDVGSTKALTHDGGGDTQAIAQMVKYAITTYQANADRVYATGDSSGAMMTEGLMAVYPDVFKGGSSFAGVPAGCWAAGDPDGSWSSQCAGGQVTHTGMEWGDLARGMDMGYSGHRPRVQLFHGDADPTINYKNHTEAIKQWTNVLGLSATPTTTVTVTLGSHQAKRESWQNACGYVVLDAFTSMGGDHGPSDALFNASFVVPFLGLDQTTATDPEVAMCGASGGAGGSGAGGASGAGGSAGAVGQGGAGSGGTSGGNGGLGAGGSSGVGLGGGGAAGGTIGNAGGGVGGTGASSGAGSGSGGSSGGSGASGASGGAVGGGGRANGGATSAGTSGVNSGSAGKSAAGGPSGGIAGSPGAGGHSSTGAGSDDESPSASPECGCHVAGQSGSGSALGLAGLMALGATLRLRRKSKRAPRA